MTDSRNNRLDASVIIPVYEQKDFLPSVLQAICAQRTSASYEIIVCDDGSSFDMLAEIERSGADYRDKVTYIRQPKDGFRLVRSRNNGIRCARGDVLIFLDGDTVVSPEFVSDHLAVHSKPGVLACGKRKTLTLDLNRVVTEVVRFDGRAGECCDQDQVGWLNTETPWMACIGGNFSIPSSADLHFDEGFVGWGSEDRDFAFRLYNNHHTPVVLPSSNALQIRRRGEDWKHLDHDGVVALLTNKLHFRKKYPSLKDSPALGIVLQCRYDLVSKRWGIGDRRENASPDNVLKEFEEWQMSLRQKRASQEKDEGHG